MVNITFYAWYDDADEESMIPQEMRARLTTGGRRNVILKKCAIDCEGGYRGWSSSEKAW